VTQREKDMYKFVKMIVLMALGVVLLNCNDQSPRTVALGIALAAHQAEWSAVDAENFDLCIASSIGETSARGFADIYYPAILEESKNPDGVFEVGGWDFDASDSCATIAPADWPPVEPSPVIGEAVAQITENAFVLIEEAIRDKEKDECKKGIALGAVEAAKYQVSAIEREILVDPDFKMTGPSVTVNYTGCQGINEDLQFPEIVAEAILRDDLPTVAETVLGDDDSADQ